MEEVEAAAQTRQHLRFQSPATSRASLVAVAVTPLSTARSAFLRSTDDELEQEAELEAQAMLVRVRAAPPSPPPLIGQGKPLASADVMMLPSSARADMTTTQGGHQMHHTVL